MNYKFFDKKSSGGAATLANESPVKNENIYENENIMKIFIWKY